MYRTICTHLWTDKKVQRLSVAGKCLFVYLITNPHSHMSGIYYLPNEMIKKETGITDTLCHTLWDTLSDPSMNLAYTDPETSTVFVVNMFSYQGKGEKNERCAAHHLDTLHDTPLIERFLERYPKVTQFLSDTLSDTLSDPSKRCPSVPNPIPVLLTTPNPDLQSNPQTTTQRVNGHAGKGKRALSDADKPTEKHFEFGRSLGVDVGPEWGKFKNYCLAHDKRYANFEAAFRNWLANAVTMGRK